MRNIQRVLSYVIAAGFIFSGMNSGAEEADTFLEAVTGGVPKVNERLRYEHAEQEGRSKADSFTLRSRIGYGTKDYKGFKVFVEFEDVTALNDSDAYSQAGTNPGASNRTVVADVEGLEVNQVFVSYENFGTVAKVGRQRLILDDARFVGNVGWRQNEQTFDAAFLQNSSIPNVDLRYAYLSRVYRIFGPENGAKPSGSAGNAAEFESDSHLANISYSPLPCLSLTGFGYFLRLGEGAVGNANSSDTVGLNLSLSKELCEKATLKGFFAYASQADNQETPVGVDYSADYYKVDISGNCEKGGSLGLGYEVLGSDDGVSFKTPLATAHKFNGWADVFLATPADGLEDMYVYVGGVCPMSGVSLKAYYHNFSSSEGSIDYGSEVDVVVQKACGKNIKLISKYSSYQAANDADNPRATDVEKISLELNFMF